MSRMDAVNAVMDAVRKHERIVLFRHLRPDGDCIGATLGLHRVLADSFPDKTITLADADCPEYLAFLKGEMPAPARSAEGALGIVLDTATLARVSSPLYLQCQTLVKIDHHIPVEDYGDIAWVEEERSSACEMVALFCQASRGELTVTPRAATCLYAGMVTDTGRFRFSGVSGDTMRLAGYLLDMGADARSVFANLYLEAFDALRFKAYAYGHIRRTEHGAAYLYIDLETQNAYGLSFSDASASVSMMDGIKGCLCWLAFIAAHDGGIRVRLRSRFMTIDALAAKYGGGGHACAAGANIQSEDDMNALIADADALVKAYKETHNDWI